MKSHYQGGGAVIPEVTADPAVPETRERHDDDPFRELMAHLEQIFWIKNAADDAVLYISPAYETVFGRTCQSLYDRFQSFLDALHPEDQARVAQAVAEQHATGGYEEEYRIVRPDGTLRWIWARSYPVRDGRGRVLRFAGIADDITARKRAETELRAAHADLEQRVLERTAELAAAKERAEAADRVKSVFLTTMSHELRTPLNSIIGFTSILLQGLVGKLNAEQTKQMGIVRDSGQHLLALINDILDISKIEAGQIEVAVAPFDLRETIQSVLQTVTPLANTKHLPLIAQVSPEVGQITTDRRRVEQVLLNLLSNAIKFTEQGSVTLTAETAPRTVPAPDPSPLPGEASPQPGGGTLHLTVADTGIGIRAEDRGKLFQPFRQLDAGRVRQQEGTGLGLAICKRVVERLGGTLTFQSDWGRGSRFLFTLPIPLETTS